MVHASILLQIRDGLIVSCQAQEQDPLFGSGMMTRMALAAKDGGAVGIRANGGEDIRSIKETTGLPVIGIVKRVYPNSEVYITPTMREVDEVVANGADIVALDATMRPRPDGQSSHDFLREVKEKYPHILVMADVSTFEEGQRAEVDGADLVASTMSGYTEYTKHKTAPDFALLERLAKSVKVPIVAEGRISYPEQAKQCLEVGCWSVVVGSAITRPQEITRAFVEYINQGTGEGGESLDLRINEAK